MALHVGRATSIGNGWGPFAGGLVLAALIVGGVLLVEKIGPLPGWIIPVAVAVMLTIAASLLSAYPKTKPAGKVLWWVVVTAVVISIAWWLTGQIRGVQPLRAAVPVFPLQYANLKPVAGSLAPRPTPATIAIPKEAGVWEVSIDGTNEYGYREPIGHRTGIVVKPDQRIVVRHLGGVPAVNDHGDRFSLCGIKRRIHPGETFRFPEQLYGIWIGFIAGDKFRYMRWPCGEKENSVTNETSLEMELALFFNTNESYNLHGITHDYGFAYAGWDGERARFEVRLLKE